MSTDLFSWDSMSQNLTKDAMSSGHKNNIDERFWRLSLDKDKNGGALVRILPDSENTPFIKLEKINASMGDRKSFFVNEWSPQSIALTDPFADKFGELWNHKLGNNDKDANNNWLCPYKQIAKRLGRGTRFIVNIKIIKDPANPDNEGKIFLYDMSPTIFDIVKSALKPTESEIALGGEAKAVFNPIAGHNFLIKAKNGSNNIVTYTDSKFDEKVTSAYAGETLEDKQRAAVEDIKASSHTLSDFLKPDFYLSTEELTTKMEKFLAQIPAYLTLFPKVEKAKEAAPATTETVDEGVIDTGLNLTVETTVETPAETIETVVETPTEKKVDAAVIEVHSAVTDDLDSLLASIDD